MITPRWRCRLQVVYRTNHFWNIHVSVWQIVNLSPAYKHFLITKIFWWSKWVFFIKPYNYKLYLNLFLYVYNTIPCNKFWMCLLWRVITAKINFVVQYALFTICRICCGVAVLIFYVHEWVQWRSHRTSTIGGANIHISCYEMIGVALDMVLFLSAETVIDS